MLNKLEKLLEINMQLKNMNGYLETQIFINTDNISSKRAKKGKKFFRKNKAAIKTIYRERF